MVGSWSFISLPCLKHFFSVTAVKVGCPFISFCLAAESLLQFPSSLDLLSILVQLSLVIVCKLMQLMHDRDLFSPLYHLLFLSCFFLLAVSPSLSINLVLLLWAFYILPPLQRDNLMLFKLLLQAVKPSYFTTIPSRLLLDSPWIYF